MFLKGELVRSDQVNTDSDLTQECIQTAAEVLDKMDQAVDPCQDFHKFACGKYKGNFSYIESLEIMTANMIEILQEPSNPSNPNQEPWEQALRYY